MFLYVTLGTNDVKRSGHFYDAAMATLGYARNFEDESEVGYGPVPKPAGYWSSTLWITKPHLKYAATWGNGTMVAFPAKTRQQVREFHAAAIAHGGTDDGRPGLRPYHHTFYSCYVRDPDGNKLSVVCEAQGE
jgi:catechol 2,3-dioxygenase-like lactoylglutathione lyase family enzyme